MGGVAGEAVEAVVAVEAVEAVAGQVAAVEEEGGASHPAPTASQEPSSRSPTRLPQSRSLPKRSVDPGSYRGRSCRPFCSTAYSTKPPRRRRNSRAAPNAPNPRSVVEVGVALPAGILAPVRARDTSKSQRPNRRRGGRVRRRRSARPRPNGRRPTKQSRCRRAASAAFRPRSGAEPWVHRAGSRSNFRPCTAPSRRRHPFPGQRR